MELGPKRNVSPIFWPENDVETRKLGRLVQYDHGPEREEPGSGARRG